MGIENIKRWHWAILGVLMGLAFSFSWQGSEPDAERHISQNVFEREARTQVLAKGSEPRQPMLQNIVVRPPVEDFRMREDKKVQLVMGVRINGYSEKLKSYNRVPFAYIAQVPYTPVIPPDKAKVTPTWTVMEFLTAAHDEINPDMHVRYAWEAKPRTNMLMWSVGGLVVIGGIWPTILSILTGAGFGRAPQPREDDYDLNRFGKGKKAVPMAKVATAGLVDQDRRRLDALNEALESQLDAAGVVMTDDAPTSNDDSAVGAPSPATPLTETPVEPATVTAQTHETKHETFEDLRKRYAAGDVYPVARGGNKKPGE